MYFIVQNCLNWKGKILNVLINNVNLHTDKSRHQARGEQKVKNKQ